MRVRADRIRETIHFRLDDRNEFGKMRGDTVLDLIDDSLKLNRTYTSYHAFDFVFFLGIDHP